MYEEFLGTDFPLIKNNFEFLDVWIWISWEFQLDD